MEFKQGFSDSWLLEGLQIASGERVKVTVLMRELLHEAESASEFVLKPHLVLAMNCVHLSFSLGVS